MLDYFNKTKEFSWTLVYAYNDLAEEHADQLSSNSSLPTFIPESQRRSLESTMRPKEIPQSKSGLSNRWSRLKRCNNNDSNYFLEKFKEFYNNKYGEDEQQEVVEEDINKEEDNLEEETPAVTTNDGFRTITFTLSLHSRNLINCQNTVILSKNYWNEFYKKKINYKNNISKKKPEKKATNMYTANTEVSI